MHHNSRNQLQPYGDYGNNFMQNFLPSLLLIPALETNELLHLNELVGELAQASTSICYKFYTVPL